MEMIAALLIGTAFFAATVIYAHWRDEGCDRRS